MSFLPRPYQVEAIDAAVNFFRENTRYHAIEILPTGSGKSVVIANIPQQLDGRMLVLQPSKEILEQNVAKYRSYGYRAGIYSASGGGKYLDDVTFATIGSIGKKANLFRDFRYCIIDECHLVNPEQGMYCDFIRSQKQMKFLGLTATPYRLVSEFEGSQLRFITRTDPRIFSKVLYSIQNNVLFDAGYLAKLEYFRFDLVDRSMLELTKNGSDFTDESVRRYYREINMPAKIITYANSILSQRKNLLVFCTLIKEANEVSRGIPGSVVLTGDTDTNVRAGMLKAFKAGKIRCIVNVGVLTTGFDYPELEAVLIGKSTMSLSWFYQVVGRAMRIHPLKDSGWIVDLGGNLELFGKIETMQITTDLKGQICIKNNGRQLTDKTFTKK